MTMYKQGPGQQTKKCDVLTRANPVGKFVDKVVDKLSAQAAFSYCTVTRPLTMPPCRILLIHIAQPRRQRATNRQEALELN